MRVSEAVTGPRLVLYTDGSQDNKHFAGAGVACRDFFTGASDAWKKYTYGCDGEKRRR
jgi:hypothetical protein